MFPTQPLTELELERLSTFLDHNGQISLEGVDGFFCALVSGPELVLPSEYYTKIWNEDHSFASAAEATDILGLLMRHWNVVADALLTSLEADDPYLPLLGEDDDGEVTGNDWAAGFMLGIGMRPEAWNNYLREEGNSAFIMPMLMLFYENHPDRELCSPKITPEMRVELLAEMQICLLDIYQHFAEIRSKEMMGSSTPRRRQAAKVGRNDRCPCGSGKKFKQCCGVSRTTH